MKFIIPLVLMFFSLTAYSISNPDRALLPSGNILKNGGGEQGISNWVAVDGTISNNTTYIAPGGGGASLLLTCTSDTCSMTQDYTTGANWTGVNVTLSCWIKTADDAVDICARADGANLAGSCWSNKDNNTGTISVDDNWHEYNIDFVAGTTSIGVQISNPTDTDTTYVDGCRLSPSTNVGEVAQAGFFGSLTWSLTANCAWLGNTGSFANFGADEHCDNNVRVAVDGLGHVSSVLTAEDGSEGTMPQIKFSSMMPGDYEIYAIGTMGARDADGASAYGQMRFSDGTTGTESNRLGIYTPNATTDPFLITPTLIGHIKYTTAQSNVTLQVQHWLEAGDNMTIDVAAGTFTIYVKYYPPTSKIYQGDDQWFVAGYISGANITITAADVTNFTELSQSNALTLTPSTGSAPVGILCANGNAETVGTYTCPSSNEAVGITFNKSGKVECLFSHSTDISTNASGEAMNITYTLGRSPDANGLYTGVLQWSGDTSAKLNIYDVGSTAAQNGLQTTTRGLFNCNGKCNIREFYEMDIVNTPDNALIRADADANQGQPSIFFLCKNYNSKINASFADVYKIPGSSTGNPVIVSALIAADATISEEDDNFLASCTDADPRVCTTTTSYFKADPKCWATPTVAGNLANVTGDTTTTITIDVTDVSTSFNLFCQGVK